MVRHASAIRRRPHDGSSPPAAPRRLLLRSLLRRGGRIRYARCRDRRHPHRARILAARGVRSLAHRQYGTGGLWRARCPDPGPGLCHGLRSLRPRRDGRAPAALLLGHRALLADLGLRGLSRHAPGLAGHSRLRRVLRDPAIPDFQLHQSLDRRYRGVPDLDGLPRRLHADLAPEGGLDLSRPAHARHFRGHPDTARAAGCRHGQCFAPGEP